MGTDDTAILDASNQGTDETSVASKAEGSSEDTGSESNDYGKNQKIRAEKAEAEIKRLKALVADSSKDGVKPENINKTNEQKPSSPNEVLSLAKLYAKGLEDDQIEYLQKIAAVEGKTLDEASKTDLYTTWNSQRDQRIRDEKAQLPASKGGKVVAKKDFNTPGISDEDHKALFKARQR